MKNGTAEIFKYENMRNVRDMKEYENYIIELCSAEEMFFAVSVFFF